MSDLEKTDHNGTPAASRAAVRSIARPMTAVRERRRAAGQAVAADGSVIAMAPALTFTAERIREALRDVIDAERSCSIIDLGLVYGIEVVNRNVKITMTMTAPDCSARGHILSGVRERVRMIAGVDGVEIELVWRPPWSPQRMRDAASTRSGVMARAR